MESSTTRSAFAREFLAASAVFVVCLLWIFRAPIRTGGVESFQALPQPASAATLGLSDELYELESVLVAQTRVIKRGFFPSWSPYSAAGTPLIGKMQNGVFAPEHLLLYVLPLAALPYALMLVLAAKFYVAYIFTYLFARSLRVNFSGAVFAGIMYVFTEVIDGGIFSWNATAAYLPLLLLLAEASLGGQRRRARFLLPWAVAFTFFGGHFESAFYVNLVAGIYFLGRLRGDAATPRGEKLGRLFGFAAPASAGAILAGVQIVPAYEYVQNSYNKIWHDTSYWGFWDYHTISKHLSRDDAPMLALGLVGLALFAATLRRGLKSSGLPALAAAAVALAVAGACLANLGFDDSLSRLACRYDTADLLSWICGFFLLFTAFWAWRDEDQHPGIKMLGVVMTGSIALMLKVPPFTNILLHAPPFINFHNSLGHRWEFNLASAILCAAAVQKMALVAGGPWAPRREAALRALRVLAVFVLGYLGSQALKGPLARRIPAGIDAPRGKSAADGGISAPRLVTFNRSFTVAGWIPADRPVASVAVEFVKEPPWSAANQVIADLSVRGARRSFSATIPTPAERGLYVPGALVTYADGAVKYFSGALVDVERRGGGWLAAGAVLLFPLLFLCGAFAPRAAAALVMVWMMGQWPSAAVPASQLPYRYGGIDKILEDGSPLRVGALQADLLHADYLNVYGLADIRPGGDNIDVLPHIYFSMLTSHFVRVGHDENNFHNSGQKAEYEKGLRLFGLANVKYFIDNPDTTVAHPGLERVYRGPDMAVFKNKYYGPRASFHDRFAYFPLGDWTDFARQQDIVSPLARAVDAGPFDEKGLLYLNDLPAEPFTPSALKGPARSSVLMNVNTPDRVRVEVEADRPGFLFLADTLFPGWVALRDGAKVPILRSWLTFRAVQVPAGKSVVEFLYRPIGLLLALDLSVAGALMWLALLYAYWPVSDGDLSLQYAGSVELVLVGAVLLFWSVWSAVRYQGGFLVHAWAASLLGAAAAAVVLPRARRWILVCGCALFAGLGGLAWGGTKYWRAPGVTPRSDGGAALAHFDQGVLLAGQGKKEEAIHEYESALRENPDYADARLYLASALNDQAVALTGQGKTDEAIGELYAAVSAKPDWALAHFDLGILLAQKGRPDDATRQFDLAVRLKPDWALAQSNLANLLAGHGKVDEGIRHYLLAIKADPNSADAHYGLAIALAGQKKTDAAILQYREAIRANPNHPFAHNYLALALTGQGKTDEAIAEYLLAIKAKPDWAEPHNSVGYLLAKQGRKDEAIAQFRQALALNPGYEQARKNLDALIK